MFHYKIIKKSKYNQSYQHHISKNYKKENEKYAKQSIYQYLKIHLSKSENKLL